jgi:hypothetical protein
VARRLAKVLNGRAAQQPFARAEDGVRRFEQALPRLVPGARIHSWQTSQDSLLVRLDLSQCPVTGYRDRFGVDLVDPPTRSTPENTRISLLLPNGSRWIPPQHSPLRAWRELGLISASGEPTRRGIIASFYQHGEGLAIAAALEQDDYSAASLALHIANLRGGHRFAAAEGGDSERLAAACRDAYGAATHEGYLQLGIPVGYGEGVAEALQSLLDKRSTLRRLAFGDLGHGDLERACREWISLLRRSVSTPALPWTRWTDFQQAAARLLEQLESGMPQPVTDPSLVEAGQLQGVSHHSLSLRDFQPLSAPVSRR